MEIITGIQVCLILWMNINDKENDGKKTFLANPKHQYRVSESGEHDYRANNKKNGDYYEYPCLSPFSNELWLKGEWWKEKLFLQIQRINIVYSIMENMIIVPITKKNGYCYQYQVCLISWVNIDCKENSWAKRFSCKFKASRFCIPMWKTWLLCQ